MSDAPILAPLNRVADIEQASDFEKKHTPYIECERQGEQLTVRVKVGHYVTHPNQPDHFIQWIDIHANGAPVARFEGAPVVAEPVVTCVLNIEPGASIGAVENCNLHGLWAAEVTAP